MREKQLALPSTSLVHYYRLGLLSHLTSGLLVSRSLDHGNWTRCRYVYTEDGARSVVPSGDEKRVPVPRGASDEDGPSILPSFAKMEHLPP